MIPLTFIFTFAQEAKLSLQPLWTIALQSVRRKQTSYSSDRKVRGEAKTGDKQKPMVAPTCSLQIQRLLLSRPRQWDGKRQGKSGELIYLNPDIDLQCRIWVLYDNMNRRRNRSFSQVTATAGQGLKTALKSLLWAETTTFNALSTTV